MKHALAAILMIGGFYAACALLHGLLAWLGNA